MFSSLFSHDDTFIHLNAGTLSRIPLEVLSWMEEARREAEKNPTRSVFETAGQFWQVQERLAPFLGCSPGDLFLRSNITAALGDFLFGLELEGEGEILVTGMEYGATANIAKVRAAQLGFSFRAAELPLGPEVTAAALEEAVAGAFREKTRILVLSHVLTGTGTILPLEAIARRAREKGIVVVVDGAHAVGALPLDISALGVDFYGGNFHKWFLGPVGTAFGWVDPRWKGKIEWKFGGWASFERPPHYKGFLGDEEAARRVIPGTIDATPFRALVKVLEFWERHGPGKIRAYQQKLCDQAAEAMEARGWERLSPRDPALLGPLVAFGQPAGWPSLPAPELATRIYLEAKVQVALPLLQGRPGLRLSPGIYASEALVAEGTARLGNWRP